MAAAQLDRDILNCIYFRTVNRVTVTPVILDLKYQIYSGRRCASVGRIYTQEQEQDSCKFPGNIIAIFYKCYLDFCVLVPRSAIR